MKQQKINEEKINEEKEYESFTFKGCIPQDNFIGSKVSDKLSKQLISVINADFVAKVRWMLEDYINLPISNEKLFTRSSILLNQIKNNPSSDYSNLFTLENTEAVLQIWLESVSDGLNATEVKVLMKACVEVNDLKI